MFSNQIDLSNHSAKSYKKLFWISLLVLLPLVILGFTTKNIGAKSGLKPPATFDANDNTFQLAYVDRDIKKEQVTLQLYVKQNKIDPLHPIYGYVASSRGGSTKKMTTDMQKINDSYYVLKIYHVKPRLKNLFVAVQTKKENKGFSKSVRAARISIKDISAKQNKVNQSRATYQENYLRFMVTVSQLSIDSKVKQINRINDRIKNYQSDLNEQEKTLKLQSGSDRAKTKQRISDTKDEIDSQRKSIDKASQAIKKLKVTKQEYEAKLNQ